MGHGIVRVESHSGLEELDSIGVAGALIGLHAAIELVARLEFVATGSEENQQPDSHDEYFALHRFRY